MRDWMVTGGLVLACVAPVGAQTIDMGTTFHESERRATRVVTWFDDSYAVSERDPEGRVTAQLFDKASHTVVATAERRERGEGANDWVQARVGTDRIALPLGRARSLGADWDHGQLRRLWHDTRERERRGRRRMGRLVWHDGYFADAGLVASVRPGKALDPDKGVEAVATEFPGVIVIAQRSAQRGTRPGVSHSTFTARLVSTSTGREVGFVRWFDKARVVTWKFPNGAEGVAMESRIPGGFRFTPSMAWANVQATLFLDESLQKAGEQMLKPAAARWASGLTMQRASARGGGSCDGAPDGCTGLHYLDWTSVRACCDRHDMCFEADASNCCTAWSWLAFWDRMECTQCNMQVVGCFVSTMFDWGGGGGGGGDTGGNSCNDGTVCTRCRNGDWCPPQCDWCADAY